MATKLTVNGVSTTTTPGTEQYEVFYTGYRTRRKKHYQYLSTLMGNCSPAWLEHSQSADNAVMNGSLNEISNHINNIEM